MPGTSICNKALRQSTTPPVRKCHCFVSCPYRQLTVSLLIKQIASSIIATGLSWRDALSIIAVGYFILAIVIALNGATGVLYHAPFPVLARASWGFWGSYVAIVLRVILAVFWFAIQTMNGAECLRIMIGAIWPSFLRLHNEIPEEQGITTNQMVSFLIFWLLQLPFLMMHPNMVRWLC